MTKKKHFCLSFTGKSLVWRICLEWELKRPPKNLQSNPHPHPPPAGVMQWHIQCFLMQDQAWFRKNSAWCIAWRDCANFSPFHMTCFAGSANWNRIKIELILFASILSMFISITNQHSSMKVKKNSYLVPILPHLL